MKSSHCAVRLLDWQAAHIMRPLWSTGSSAQQSSQACRPRSRTGLRIPGVPPCIQMTCAQTDARKTLDFTMTTSNPCILLWCITRACYLASPHLARAPGVGQVLQVPLQPLNASTLRAHRARGRSIAAQYPESLDTTMLCRWAVLSETGDAACYSMLSTHHDDANNDTKETQGTAGKGNQRRLHDEDLIPAYARAWMHVLACAAMVRRAVRLTYLPKISTTRIFTNSVEFCASDKAQLLPTMPTHNLRAHNDATHTPGERASPRAALLRCCIEFLQRAAAELCPICSGQRQTYPHARFANPVVIPAPKMAYPEYIAVLLNQPPGRGSVVSILVCKMMATITP